MNYDILNMAIAEHYEARDRAIKRLISLHKEGLDIENEEILERVLASCGLRADGFLSEKDSILQEVKRRIR